MKIKFAHLREHGRSGGWVNFVVFEARSASGTRDDNARLLAQLTTKARGANLRIDQSALAFKRGGRVQFFGSPPLVDYLSKSGVPHWTHSINM